MMELRAFVAHILFVTHANVEMDPATPVPQWKLSPAGIHRHEAFNGSPWVSAVSSIYCSDERKAVDGAEILGKHLRIPFEIVHSLHENDRSATGYLPPAEFDTVVGEFFANPQQSVRGWERAVDAQDRIHAALAGIVARDRTGGDIAIVSHGGVGALLLCKLSGAPISRANEQPGTGGGNFFVIDRSSLSIVKRWSAIDG
jgi:broad specificity phosphatase PhoE